MHASWACLAWHGQYHSQSLWNGFGLMNYAVWHRMRLLKPCWLLWNALTHGSSHHIEQKDRCESQKQGILKGNLGIHEQVLWCQPHQYNLMGEHHGEICV